MPATLEELERRGLRWLLGTVADIKATQDLHTETLGDHTRRLDRIEGDVRGLRSDLPAIVGEAVREALSEHD